MKEWLAIYCWMCGHMHVYEYSECVPTSCPQCKQVDWYIKRSENKPIIVIPPNNSSSTQQCNNSPAGPSNNATTCCDQFKGHGWKLCQKCGKPL